MSGIINHDPYAGGSDIAFEQGKFWERHVLEELVTVASTDTSVDLSRKIPANSLVVSAHMNWATAISLSTAVKVGLGQDSDPDQLALSSTTVTKNHKTDKPQSTAITSEYTVQVEAVDTNGATAGAFSGAGTIWVRIVYDYFPGFHNAS